MTEEDKLMIFVRNVKREATADEIKETFSKYGKVVKMEIGPGGGKFK